MSTLSVPRSLTDNTNPTEAQFDTMRTYLLNFFNSGNLDQDNVATGAMAWSSLSAVGDDSTLKFTSSHGTMAYISASDYFKVQNTQGDMVWGNRTGSTLTDYMELDSTTGDLTLKGQLYFNTSIGSQGVNLLYLLSRYRKPRLTYTSNDIVTAESNFSTSTYIMGRDRLWELYDTSMSLAVDANGYGASHTGTAVSGLLVADTRTANRWYYIYAVEVQYGTQNSGAYCILVATELSPETTNITTHNTNFGTGKWVYMGVIRNGYNDGTNTNIIVKFVQGSDGFFRFTEGTVNAEGIGMTLASTTGATNLEYEIVIGNSAAATIPPVATRCVFSGHRENNGFEFHYRAIATDENHMIASGCYHKVSLTMSACMQMEVPLLDDYKLVIVIGDTSTDQRITLVGFLDHYV
jgi:hypothetical protein